MDFQEFFREVVHLQDEELIKSVCALARVVPVKKDACLLERGQTFDEFYFLASGGFCCYDLDEKNKYYIDCFMCTPGEPVVAFDFTAPSACTFVAYTDSELVALPLAQTLELIQNSEDGSACLRRMYKAAIERQADTKMHLYGSAAQRYAWFCKAYPTVVNEVSGQRIASYLGITPVTLSRVRRASAAKGKEAAEELSEDGSAPRIAK